MIKKLIGLMFVLQVAHASDYLEPEDSQFSQEFLGGYTHLVLSYLRSAYDENVTVRLIGFPSFSPEYAVGIEKVEDKSFIFYESPEMQLWGYQMIPLMENGSVQVMDDDGEFVKDKEGLSDLKRRYPKSPEDIPRESCKKEIDVRLAQDIEFVWHEMLYASKYAREPTMGKDGETYHFSATIHGYSNYAGKVWSPSRLSKTGKLVEISELMSKFCLEGKRKIEKALIRKVDSFKVELKITNKSIQSTANASGD